MCTYIQSWLLTGLIFLPMVSIAAPNLPVSTQGSMVIGCAMDESLSIDEALELALCSNPRLYQARNNIEIQRQKLLASKSSYLPSLYMNSEVYEDVSASKAKPSWGSSLSLSWLLLDFGGRSGTVDENRNLLLAAVLTQDSESLSLVSDLSRDYFAVAAAKGVIDSSQDNESAAKESFLAAQAKYLAGVGARADLLQAQTAHSEAILDSIRARGSYEKAVAQLAYTVGVDPSSPLVIDTLDESLVSGELTKSLALHIQGAMVKHPSILSARAQLEASKDRLKVVSSEGKPSLSLVSSYHDKNFAQGNSSSLDSTVIGLKFSFPLFEGFGHSARVAEAYEGVRLKETLLKQAELSVTNDIWMTYSELKTEIDSISISKSLVSSAEESSEVARGRYRTGVGSIIELLNAQTALANANQQYVQSLARWRAARIRLAASVGVLVRNDQMMPM